MYIVPACRELIVKWAGLTIKKEINTETKDFGVSGNMKKSKRVRERYVVQKRPRNSHPMSTEPTERSCKQRAAEEGTLTRRLRPPGGRNRPGKVKALEGGEWSGRRTLGGTRRKAQGNK